MATAQPFLPLWQQWLRRLIGEPAVTEPQPVPMPADYADTATTFARAYQPPAPVRRGRRRAAAGAPSRGISDFAQILLPPYDAPPTAAQAPPGSKPGDQPPEPASSVTPATGADRPSPPAVPETTATAAAPTMAPAAPARTPEEEYDALVKRYVRSPESIAEAVQARLGKAPATVGGPRIEGWNLAAMLLPLLFGGGQSSVAMLRGALAGHADRQAAGRDAGELYWKKAGDLAQRMEEQDWRHVSTAAPYHMQKVAERERLGLQRADQDLRRQKLAFDQRMQQARLAFDEFKWENVSASAQLGARMRNADRRVREAHYRAQEALGNNRLDEARRHSMEMEAGMREARAIARERAEIARGHLGVAIERARRGGTTDNQTQNRILGYYRFVERMANAVEDDLAADIGLDPAHRTRLESDLQFYESEVERLRPIATQMTGAAPPGAAAPALAPGQAAPTQPAQPKTTTKTLTRAQIRAYAQQYGVTEAEAERQAKAKGITVVP